MDEPLAVALKFGFLAVLYLFLLWIARSSMRDLARFEGPAAAAEPAEAPGHAATVLASRPRRQGSTRRSRWWRPWATSRARPSTCARARTLGRSDSAEIRIDDPFASSAHARVFARGEFMYVEDMGSTNGTYLNGRQLKTAERLKMADVIRIGDTEYRYRE